MQIGIWSFLNSLRVLYAHCCQHSMRVLAASSVQSIEADKKQGPLSFYCPQTLDENHLQSVLLIHGALWRALQ